MNKMPSPLSITPCYTQETIITPRGRNLTIVHEVADARGIPRDELFSKSRRKYLVDARHEAWLRLQDEADLSLPQIGAIFNRHHTTVLSGIRKAKMKATTSWSVSVALRIFVRDGKRVLQQRWTRLKDGKIEERWLDIPEIQEADDALAE